MAINFLSLSYKANSVAKCWLFVGCIIHGGMWCHVSYMMVNCVPSERVAY